MKSFALVVKEDRVSQKTAKTIQEQLLPIMPYDEKQPELVISVGGDGTMLRSVHHYMHCPCYFVGVHTGTLGFLTDFQKEEVDTLVASIKGGTYRSSDLCLLDVIIHQNKGIDVLHALNEVRVDYGFATQVMDVYIDEDHLETFRGNGMCVSTQVGSTAYNKSLGGAVLYPGNPLMQLTEVAGIQHNAYRSLGSPLILGKPQCIHFVYKQKQDTLYLGIDHRAFTLQDVTKVSISISSKQIHFIEYREMSFISRLRRAYIKS